MSGIKILNKVSDLEGVQFTSGNHVFYSETTEESSVTYHLRDSYSFKYCYEGSETYLVNGQRKILKRGEGMIINPGSQVEWSCPQQLRSKGFSAFLSPSIIEYVKSQYGSSERLFKEKGDNSLRRYIFFDYPFACGNQIGRLFELCRNGLFLDRHVEDFLLRLCFEMVIANEPLKKMMNNQKPIKVSTKLELIKKLSFANDLIRQSIYEDLDLDTISLESGISKFHFVRTFKKIYGISPIKLLIHLRLAESLRLIRNGIRPSTIAADLHFYDMSHFARMFRKLFGHYPTEVVTCREH